MEPTGEQQGSDTSQAGVLFEGARQRRHVPNRRAARDAAYQAFLRTPPLSGRGSFQALESEYLRIVAAWGEDPEQYRVSGSTLYRWTRPAPVKVRWRTSRGEVQGERSQRTRYKYAAIVRHLWLALRDGERFETLAQAADVLSRPRVSVRTLYRAVNHWGLGCGRWARRPSEHQARVLMDVLREGPGEGVPLPRWAPGRRGRQAKPAAA